MPQPTTEQGLPVAGLASAVLAEMKELGYAESSLNTYRSIFDKMTAYFEDKGIGTFSLEQGHAFVLDYCGDRLNDDKTFKNYFRAIHMAGDYQRYGMIFRQTQAGKKDFTEGFKPLADSFLDSLAKTGRTADGTLYSYRKKLFRFEGFLLDRGVDSISKVTGHHIDVYVETLSGYSKNTISFSLTCLRRLLDFAYTNGYLAQQFSVRVPDVRYRQSSRLPATATPEETERILKNIDNNNPVGKRNYAMILMYARYGIRPSDILALQFGALDWDRNQVSFYQQKTGYRQEFPLYEDVGWAIIDYLKNGRPQTSSQNVFVAHTPPFGKMASEAYVTRCISRAVQKAGIKIPREKTVGAYIFRRSLATNMLNGGATIYEVGQVLGHHDFSSTEHYISSSMDMLRQCAREVAF